MRYRSKSGFTLVELLVVITIIGVLIALLLPAVQSARESGRNTQCQNNLRSIAQACIHHEQAQGFLPTGGWGATWAGDPNRGFSSRQPGGWIFNILPYMDQKALHDLGVYSDPTQMDGPKAQMGATLQAVLPVLHCPTRRRAVMYPWKATRGWVNITAPTAPLDAHGAVLVGRTDYAANAGDFTQDNVQNAATGIVDGPALSQTSSSPPSPDDPYAIGDATADWSTISQDAISATGAMYIHSQVRMVQISDGIGKTYLCGERYICPDFYTTGGGLDDNLSWDQGYDTNTYRWTCQFSTPPCLLNGATAAMQAGTLVNNNNATVAAQYVPARDTPGRDSSPLYLPNLQTLVPGFAINGNRNFGSAHPTSFNMAFCDGSVHPIRFSVDSLTHQYLGNRQDQLILPNMNGTTLGPYPVPIDPAKYLP